MWILRCEIHIFCLKIGKGKNLLSTKKKIVISCVITFFATLAVGTLTVGILMKSDGFDYQKFAYIKNIIQNKFIYKTDQNKMTDYALSGMVAALGDPYSSYYDKDSFESRMDTFSGNYVGIGVTMVYPDSEDYPQIQDIYEGSTAESAGLLRGDYLISVDHQKFTHKNYETLIHYTRGTDLKNPVGTKMQIVIKRDNEEKTITVERGNIKTSQVVYKMVSDTVGYIRVAKFDGNTIPGIKEALQSLHQKNMQSLVFDLRDNPGGDLQVVCEACDLFLDKGTIVYTENKQGKKTYYHSKDGSDTTPMVVLINGNSASASEVFTGAMKDRDRATIMGKTSFGKGIVQSLFQLPDGSGLSLTTEQYFTPNGKNIHKKGIKPDIEVSLSEAAQKKTIPQLIYSEDSQLQAAVSELSSKG